MEFTVILACLLLQRVFHFDHLGRQFDWFAIYYQKLRRFDQILPGWSGFAGILLIILPLVALFSVLSVLVYHWFGELVYYLLNLVVIWYCLDGRLLQLSDVKSMTPSQLLAISYVRIFAIIFWYIILGVVGVVVYICIVNLRSVLEHKNQVNASEEHLLSAITKVEGVFDWLPLRLMGITYALVGQFGASFQLWCKQFFTGFEHTREQAAECGLVASGLTEAVSEPLTEETVRQIESLISRSLFVWLVVVALYVIGTWMG